MSVGLWVGMLLALVAPSNSLNSFLKCKQQISVTMSASGEQKIPAVDRRERRKFLVAGASFAAASIGSPNRSWGAYKGLDEGRSVPLSSREDRRGPPGVNKPELLPGGGTVKTNIIDLEKMLTSGQAKKMDDKLAKLEKETGYKVRILTQSYPNTPGAAIKDYWGVDDNTVVLVVDKGAYRSDGGTTTNMLNFNVGSNVELQIAPRVFTGLRNIFGGKQYRSNGDDVVIESTIDAICTCLRSEDGGCPDVPDEFKAMSSGKLI